MNNQDKCFCGKRATGYINTIPHCRKHLAIELWNRKSKRKRKKLKQKRNKKFK